MQPKESKSNWHFNVSIAKSAVRIFAGVALLCADQWYVNVAGTLLILAEVLGIVEEF